MANPFTLSLSSLRGDTDALSKQLEASNEALTATTEAQQKQSLITQSARKQATEGENPAESIGKSIGTILFGNKDISKSQEKELEYAAKIAELEKVRDVQAQRVQGQEELNKFASMADQATMEAMTLFDAANRGKYGEDRTIPADFEKAILSIVNAPQNVQGQFKSTGYKIEGQSVVNIKGQPFVIGKATDAQGNSQTFQQNVEILFSDNGKARHALKSQKNAAATSAVNAFVGEETADTKIAQAEASLADTQANKAKTSAEARALESSVEVNKQVAGALSDFYGRDVLPAEVENMERLFTPSFQKSSTKLNTDANVAAERVPQVENIKNILEKAAAEGKDMTNAFAEVSTAYARLLDGMGIEIDQDVLSGKTQIGIGAIDDALGRLQLLGGSDTDRELKAMLQASISPSKTVQENLDIIEQSLQKLNRRMEAPKVYAQATRGRAALSPIGDRALTEYLSSPFTSRVIDGGQPQQQAPVDLSAQAAEILKLRKEGK